MKYKKYPSYKDSGIEWLGEIPEHWEGSKLKYVGEAIIGLTYDPKNIVDEQDGILVLRSSNLQNGKISYADNVYINMNIPDKLITKENDILICSRNGSRKLIGKNAKIDKYSVGHSFGAFTTMYRSRYNDFIFYILNSSLFTFQSSRFLTTTINQLTTGTLNDFEIPFPSLSEQQQIANFLDKATAKIDTLIEKQTKQIELLKEKRQAVISHAVTKGINPNVPMKDSGVEWLGEIPEHWIRTKIKNKLSNPITDGPHETPEFLDEGVPFISAEAISSGSINFNKKRGCITEDQNIIYSRKYTPKKFDVYMIKSGATTGVCAIVETDIKFNIWSPLAVFRSGIDLNPYYLLNFLRSSNFQMAVQLNWSFGTQQNIGMNVLENLFICIPPFEEQIEIMNYIHDKTSKIDTLIEKSKKSIELLKEKRTALISAAVTGKIDVREFE